MLDDSPVKEGDVLVEHGKLYEVVKVAKKVGFNGEEKIHVFFKPLFETNENRTLSCNIPLENLVKANIRRPVGKNEMHKILQFDLNLGNFLNQDFDIAYAKEILKKNDPKASAQLAKSIWQEIKDDIESATKSKKDIFTLSIQSLTQEVAYTFGITLEKAEAKLHNALKKAV